MVYVNLLLSAITLGFMVGIVYTLRIQADDIASIKADIATIYEILENKLSEDPTPEVEQQEQSEAPQSPI